MTDPADQPVLGARHVCTSADPWRAAPTYPARAIHPDAIDVGECSDGCCDVYRCPHCGTRWRQEAAQ